MDGLTRCASSGTSIGAWLSAAHGVKSRGLVLVSLRVGLDWLHVLLKGTWSRDWLSASQYLLDCRALALRAALGGRHVGRSLAVSFYASEW
jgi:hypothetical protein